MKIIPRIIPFNCFLEVIKIINFGIELPIFPQFLIDTIRVCVSGGMGEGIIGQMMKIGFYHGVFEDELLNMVCGLFLFLCILPIREERDIGL